MDEKYLACRKKAMTLLNHNDRTEWELRDRLQRADFEENVIEDAIAYVKSFHYIDDLRYATRFAEIYSQTRSIQRIRQDLQKRHVSEEYISIALESVSYDDTEALRKELDKQLRKYSMPLEELSYEEKQKIAGRLYRKGFRTKDIFSEMEK